MSRMSRRVFAVPFVLLFLLMSMTGCGHQLTAAEYDTKFEAINSDPTLSVAEKTRQVNAIGDDGSGQLTGAGVGVCLGILLLAFSLAVRSRSRSGASAKPVTKSSPARNDVSTVNKGDAPPPIKAVPREQQTKPEEPTKPELTKIPTNQTEVDAMPYDNRGASFFTARPMGTDHLTRIKIQVGAEIHKVSATHQEAEQVADGHAPLVRAFTVDDRTSPWYGWPEFNPFDHYWSSQEGEWTVNGSKAIACWMTLDECDSLLKGYYAGDFDQVETRVDVISAELLDLAADLGSDPDGEPAEPPGPES